MQVAFYIAAAVAVLATVMVITRANAVHALLYLIVSFLAVALIFFLLGAPFVAALEVIIYAGAIMVLFVFVIMMINPGPQALEQERRWVTQALWLGPSILSLILLGELFALVLSGSLAQVTSEMRTGAMTVGPKQVSIQLLGPYLIGVELASILLLPGLLGAYHLGRRARAKEV